MPQKEKRRVPDLGTLALEFIDLVCQDAPYFGFESLTPLISEGISHQDIRPNGDVLVWLTSTTSYAWTGEVARLRIKHSYSEEDGWYVIWVFNEGEPKLDDCGDLIPMMTGVFDETVGWMALHPVRDEG